MEVILKEDVAKLGNRGDVVKVAEGYGRNYLLPRKLAIEATIANKAVIDQMKAAAVRRPRKKRPKPKPSPSSSKACRSASSASRARTTSFSVQSPPATSPKPSRRRASTSTAARFSCMSR